MQFRVHLPHTKGTRTPFFERRSASSTSPTTPSNNMDASSSFADAKRKELLALDSKKKSLESEAEAIVSELTAELPDGVSVGCWIMQLQLYDCQRTRLLTYNSSINTTTTGRSNGNRLTARRQRRLSTCRY